MTWKAEKQYLRVPHTTAASPAREAVIAHTGFEAIVPWKGARFEYPVKAVLGIEPRIVPPT